MGKLQFGQKAKKEESGVPVKEKKGRSKLFD
jgi:hypothetical protein